MFKQLKNIDTAFQYVRAFTFVVVVASAFTSCFIAVASFRMVKEMESKIWVLINGKAYAASLQNLADNSSAEMKDHIEMFHYFFFTLIPDEKANDANMEHAINMSDQSAKDQYNNLRESGYYTNIVSGNVNQHVIMDSIRLDEGGEQVHFRYYGREVITRATVRVTRRLVTEGSLRMLRVRSEGNSHGMLVERWRVVDNSDISVEKRGL